MAAISGSAVIPGQKVVARRAPEPVRLVRFAASSSGATWRSGRGPDPGFWERMGSRRDAEAPRENNRRKGEEQRPPLFSFFWVSASLREAFLLCRSGMTQDALSSRPLNSSAGAT